MTTEFSAEKVTKMAWTIKRSPSLPAVPAFQDPKRCHDCGHVDNHDPDVGCLHEGGSKYVEDVDGNGKHVCSCEKFIPAPTVEVASV